jgi:hypothetical protein
MRYDEEETSLCAEEIRLVARRQLTGSIVVVASLAWLGAVVAMMPAGRDGAAAAAARSAPITAPQFAAPNTKRVAAFRQWEIEIPYP